MAFHHLEWVFEGFYVPISERIDVEWAVDEDYFNLSLVSSPEICLNCFQVKEDWRAGVGWVGTPNTRTATGVCDVGDVKS